MIHVELGLVFIEGEVLVQVVGDTLDGGGCRGQRPSEKPRETTQTRDDVAHIVVVR